MIQENISLLPYNTFHIDVKAKQFAVFSGVENLSLLLQESKMDPENILILGGGSNVLFTKDFPGIVLKNEIRGIEKISENEDWVYIKAGAGVQWHQFVMHCVDNQWGGVENLSLIPGCVGATPIQNIGAYGVEVESVIEEVEAFHLEEKTSIRIKGHECRFGYRESIFKQEFKGLMAITAVIYKLRKKPLFHIEYGAIRAELERMNIDDLTLRAVSEAVIRIRQSKLPDPAVIGNAGSFFKNPEVAEDTFESLKYLHPDIVGYTLPTGMVKLAAGWLIERCGWKGHRKGEAGCHEKQALVLVNYGHANGKEIYDLSAEIVQSVQEKFGVILEREVNVF